MDTFRELMAKKLKSDGVALIYSISGSKSQLFGNMEFNKIFLNNFTDQEPTYTLDAAY